MKKLKLVAVALVIGTASLFASNMEDTEESKKLMRTQIVELLDSPNFVVENEMTVDITFTFSSQGELIVLSVDSNNSDVLSYIRKNLNYKIIENPGERDKLYTIPLKVKSA